MPEHDSDARSVNGESTETPVAPLETLSEKLVRETERILGNDLVRYDIDIFNYD